MSIKGRKSEAEKKAASSFGSAKPSGMQNDASATTCGAQNTRMTAGGTGAGHQAFFVFEGYSARRCGASCGG